MKGQRWKAILISLSLSFYPFEYNNTPSSSPFASLQLHGTDPRSFPLRFASLFPYSTLSALPGIYLLLFLIPQISLFLAGKSLTLCYESELDLIISPSKFSSLNCPRNFLFVFLVVYSLSRQKKKSCF